MGANGEQFKYRITTLNGKYRVERWNGGYWEVPIECFDTEDKARASLKLHLEMDQKWFPLPGEPL